MREALVDQLAVVGDRVAVAGQHQVDVHLPGLRAATRCRCTSAWGRSPVPSRGRVISGFEEMCLSRWSAAISIAPLAVEEDGVGGGVAGAEVHVERAVAQLDRLAVVQHARDVGARAPARGRLRDTDCSAVTTSSGIPWRSIIVARELVVGLRPPRE